MKTNVDCIHCGSFDRPCGCDHNIEINNLQTKIKELRDDVEERENRILGLEDQAEIDEEIRVKLETEVERLTLLADKREGVLISVNKSTKRRGQRINELTEEVRRKKVSIKKRDEIIEKKQAALDKCPKLIGDTLGRVQREKHQLREENKQLEADRKKYLEGCIDMTMQYSLMKEKAGHLQTELDHLKKQIDAHHKRLSEEQAGDKK
jgi:chromosome segregation ATPase